jgi:hypothetical protein
MVLNDLDKILAEYLKHFGQTKMSEYFNNIIKINNNKKGDKTNATSQKKIINSSRSNI